jgi:hypothetical protein
VYSDADADFSDNGLSPGIKQIFQQEWDILNLTNTKVSVITIGREITIYSKSF